MIIAGRTMIIFGTGDRGKSKKLISRTFSCTVFMKIRSPVASQSFNKNDLETFPHYLEVFFSSNTRNLKSSVF